MEASSITAERNRALRGTPFLEILPRNCGALRSRARPNAIREVEKIPEFAEEVALVITTKLMMCAAIPRPARVNMATKGLLSGLTRRQGVTIRMVTSAPT